MAGLESKKDNIRMILLAFTLLWVITVNAQSSQVKLEDVDKHIKFLASDALKGRDPFKEEIKLTEDYIAAQFAKAGLKSFEKIPDYKQLFVHKVVNRRDTTQPPVEYKLTNIIGYLEGNDPDLKNEFIMFGAHHDHLGIREKNGVKEVNNGANDNASGTATVIALAEYYSRTKSNKRSIIFATFTAEERGMIGSTYLSNNFPVPINNVKALLNFEMIGRSKFTDRTECNLTGKSFSDLWDIMNESVNDSLSFIVGPEKAERYFFASDNIVFVRKGVVAHTFEETFAIDDPDYHTPRDRYEVLNIKTMTDAINLCVKGVQTLISGKKTPRFLKEMPTGRNRN